MTSLSPRRLVIAGALSLLAASSGCRKSASPGRFEDFLAPVGVIVPPVCTADADGNRYTLTGYARLPTRLEVTGSDGAIEFSQEPDGRSFSLAVKVPDEVHVQTVGRERIAPGYQATQQAIDPSSFRLVTSDGEATSSERVQVTVSLEVVKHFQTHAVTGCTVHLVSAVRAR